MTGDEPRWFLPHGSASRDGCDVAVDDSLPSWQHTGLRVLSLEDGESRVLDEQGWEYVVVPLAGAVSVGCRDSDGRQHDADLAGRATVFAGPTDVAYVPAGSRLTVTGRSREVRVAVCAARVRANGPATGFRHLRAGEVPVELRGAGSCSREVRNFGVPRTLDADSIIACEVVTPAGNWSSYPPHKHDEDRAGLESELEEIYYFETQVEGAAAASGAHTGPVDPVGYQRVYGTAERPIEVFAEVRTGDVVLVPHGWHGPSMAAPGYDLYYLNVMAGPGAERAWLICDDPSHGWVRQTWEGQPVDPRLPTGGDAR
jgi:5-deoxy-glucuronate isomerase